MRKSTIFVSAVLTTFALVMLYRVAAAYNGTKNATNVAAAPTSLPAPVATDPPAAPAPTNVALSPTDAAQLAAKVIGNTNLLSAETSSYNGVNAYLITFTNNDVVYVGLDGQILGVQIAPVAPAAPAVVVAPPVQPNNKHSGSGSRSSGGGSHEGGGEHEGGDD
jgi:hypothetical protein